MICFSVSLPPSKNDLYKNVPGKGHRGRAKTEKYKAWIEKAGKELMTQKPFPMIEGHFQTYIIISKKERRFYKDGTPKNDLNNYYAALYDFMKEQQLIQDDAWEDELWAHWGEAPMGCKIYVWNPGEDIWLHIG